MNQPEILSFTFQERYLARELIQSRNHLIKYIKFLSKKYKHPADKIIFHHDLEDKSNFLFIDNFKLNGSYNYLKEELRK